MIFQDFSSLPKRSYPLAGLPLYSMLGGKVVTVIVPVTPAEAETYIGGGKRYKQPIFKLPGSKEDGIIEVIIAFVLMEDEE